MTRRCVRKSTAPWQACTLQLVSSTGRPPCWTTHCSGCKPLLMPRNPPIANCLNERASHNRDRGDAKAAFIDSQAALRYLGSPRPGQLAMAASLRTSLGDAYGMLGQFPQAIRSYQLALENLASMGREHTTAALTIANNLGVHLSRAGQV